MTSYYFIAIAALAVIAFLMGRQRAAAMPGGTRQLHSLPVYHGLFAASAAVIPMFLIAIVLGPLIPRLVEAHALGLLPLDLQPADELAKATRLREIMMVADGSAPAGSVADPVVVAGESYAAWRSIAGWLALALGIVAGFAGMALSLRTVSPHFRARNRFEVIVKVVLIACSAVAILTTIGIVFSVFFETMRFFARYPWYDFLFGLQWSPQTAIRTDQVGQSGAFGAVPLFVGTTLIMLIAMCVAGPIGLFSAIYMAEYASPRVRSVVKPVLEILAGVPTVVFGFFAALTVAPFIRQVGQTLGLDVASESALAAGLVMGIMIIPFVSSLSDDVINAVPQSLRDGSYGMGATKSETIKKVVLPAALSGLVSAFMLAISRAVGETMIVVMAAGLTGNLTFNPLAAVTTVTVQIKTLLVGDQEFDSAKTLSAFALGFVLFFFTLMLNVIALKIVQRYREQYD
ncbi:phosphate ABC transporter permease subunit PstC [Pseudoxanthobacter sp. M-2]|uniref:phosphate ABC transporter permease subunit PstC n=1 Tax=Pseudoxanthobacter sp. M-2 TaxID=3078754 RepID=UPI0038FCC823